MLLSYQLVVTVAVSLNAGGSGTKRPEPDEELDAATGSDEEMASLLRQMVVKSQPDKEHSSSEAEAGDQAGKP